MKFELFHAENTEGSIDKLARWATWLVKAMVVYTVVLSCHALVDIFYMLEGF